MSQDGENDHTTNLDDDDDDEDVDEEDLEKLQAEIARMEEEAARITKETEALEQEDTKNSKTSAKAAAAADKPARDNCSIYVGQVDYSATPEELLKHFDACGTVERVTIVCDKFTGRPKGTVACLLLGSPYCLCTRFILFPFEKPIRTH